MKKMLLTAAVLMTAMSASVFAADTPVKPAAPVAAAPAAPAATPAPAEKKMAAKPMKMMHKKAMPMKATAAKGMPMKASAVKPALEPSTDKLNQQQLDTLKKS